MQLNTILTCFEIHMNIIVKVLKKYVTRVQTTRYFTSLGGLGETLWVVPADPPWLSTQYGPDSDSVCYVVLCHFTDIL